MKIKVLILTPLPVEYDAVSLFLTGDRTNTFHGTANYEHGNFVGNHHQYSIVIREPGMKNVDMALATEKAIQYFEPNIVMLIGIAGGVKDVRIGDVLVAKKAYGYESGKEDVDGFKARPAVESFSGELLARAQALSRSSDWKKRLADGAPEAKVFIGPIAAGDKVIAGVDNPTFKRLKLHFNDTLALEMEAIGFATALQEHRQVHGMVIRGISDLCEGKSETDKQDWQPVAAQRAAAFAFELLWELDAGKWLPIQASPTNTISIEETNLSEEQKASINKLITIGRTEEAFKKLKEFAPQCQAEFQKETLQLTDRWNTFLRKSRMGLLTHDNAVVERNQIMAALIHLIDS
jgi:nucleoside phosphorylase